VSEPDSAIVFTDIVGFTEFTAEWGDDAALLLLERQDSVVRKVLPPGARVVKELGDGLLLWFPDARVAIGTCLALLDSFREESRPELPLWVRMGVHWGRPRRRGDDLVGHDVNLTSRVAATAGPGELVATDAAVRAAGEGVDGAQFEEIGPVFVRGVRDPVRLYRVTAAIP
jgi:adenylate cyclase